MSTPKTTEIFTVPLPGGQVARVPLEVLRQHVDPSARATHASSAHASATAETSDVTAHSMSVDATSGISDWHIDWEFGECDYTDELGFTQKVMAWHKHPLGTEYTEIFEG